VKVGICKCDVVQDKPGEPSESRRAGSEEGHETVSEQDRLLIGWTTDVCPGCELEADGVTKLHDIPNSMTDGAKVRISEVET
jgi:hypothetical protein